MPLVERLQPKSSKFTVNLNSSFTTAAIDAKDFTVASIQAVWQGADSTDGTMWIEVSTNGTDWNNLSASSNITLLASNDSQIWSLLDITYRYLRVAYNKGTNSAGTVVITVDLLR